MASQQRQAKGTPRRRVKRAAPPEDAAGPTAGVQPEEPASEAEQATESLEAREQQTVDPAAPRRLGFLERCLKNATFRRMVLTRLAEKVR